jgi:hypothetical protein
VTLYTAAVFVHVVGAVLLSGTLTVEGLSIRSLRRATTNEEVRAWSAVVEMNRVIGPLSAFGILVPGVYMTATTWGPVAWIDAGLAAYVLIAVFGAVNGLRIVAIQRTAATSAGPVAAQLAERLQDPLLPTSWRTRVAIAVGVLLLMAAKPGLGGAVVAIAVAAALGLASSTPAWRRS